MRRKIEKIWSLKKQKTKNPRRGIVDGKSFARRVSHPPHGADQGAARRKLLGTLN